MAIRKEIIFSARDDGASSVINRMAESAEKADNAFSRLRGSFGSSSGGEGPGGGKSFVFGNQVPNNQSMAGGGMQSINFYLKQIINTVREGSDSIVEAIYDISSNQQQIGGAGGVPGGSGGIGGGGISSIRPGGNSFLRMGKRGIALGAGAAAGFGLFKTMLGETERREMDLRQISAMSGTSVRDLFSQREGVGRNRRYDAQDLNVELSELNSQIVPASMRATGRSSNRRSDALRGLELEFGGGIGRDVVMGLQRLTRVIEDGNIGDPTQTANRVFGSLSGTGTFGADNKDLSQFNEIMSGFLQFQESRFAETGFAGSSDSFDLMRRLKLTGGAFERGDYMFRTMENISQGLSDTSNPSVQALKMGTLRRLNPDMNFAEIMAEMEKGTESKGFLRGTLKNVRSMTDDESMQSIFLRQLTGGKVSYNDALRMLKSDQFTQESLDRDVSDTGDRLDFKKRALDASSGTKAAADVFREGIGDVTSKLGDIIGIFEEVRKIIRNQ